MNDQARDHYPSVRLYCDDGEHHAARGRTWIETMIRLPEPDPSGHYWRADNVKRSKIARQSGILPGRREHAAKETAITADGKVLDPADRKNTRSREAAIGGGEYRAARQGLEGQQREEHAEAYADSLDGTRVTYPFRCGCGLHVPVRAETLEPILESLHMAGVEELSLNGLRTLVS